MDCKRCHQRPTPGGRKQICEECAAAKRTCERCGTSKNMPKLGKFCRQCVSKVRSERSIRGDAHKWTPQEDAIVRAAYAEHRHQKALVVAMRRLPGVNRGQIKSRALRLGLTKLGAKPAAWSRAELEVLERHAHLHPKRIARHLPGRTATAIALQLRRSAISADGLTVTGAAEVLGVDRGTVAEWVRKGMLQGQHTGKIQGGGEMYYISLHSMREFVIAHHHLIDPGKLARAGSWSWFMDLLTGGAAGMRGDLEEAPPRVVDEDADQEHQRVSDLLSKSLASEILRVRTISEDEHARRSGMSTRALVSAMSGARTLSWSDLVSIVAGAGVVAEFKLSS